MKNLITMFTHPILGRASVSKGKNKKADMEIPAVESESKPF
jgi:hypothetical protein